MKKNKLTFFTVFTLVILLSGCRNRVETLPATEPSRPLATVESTSTEPHSTRETETGFTEVTEASVHTVPPEALTEATIEDGNGPIASQENAAKAK